jgi:Pyruvate/2-oxoacid:ferredoxin oxidoreductase gamma subunit
VIEAKAIEYIREMQELTVSNGAQLIKEETDRKKKYIGERTALAFENDAAEYKAKKAEYAKRSNMTVVTAGRRIMSMSKKAEMKKAEKEPERDEDAENMLKYLGGVASELIEQNKRIKAAQGTFGGKVEKAN